MVKKTENALHGMKAIGQYYGRSEATIMKLHAQFGFPMKKEAGGWSSDKALVDQWHQDYVAGRTERWIDGKTAP